MGGRDVEQPRLGNDTAHIYVYAAGADFNSDLLNAWETALAANKTRVASTSYANAEPNFGGIGQPSISDFTDVTRSMTLMGWTLVAASGDSGGDEGCTRGSVQYPSTDPNVVAVGGTSLTLSSSPLAYSSETAWCGNACGPNGACKIVTAVGGGGGDGDGDCSDTFGAVSWNSAACAGKHRATPDISLNAAGAGQIVYYSYSGPPSCFSNTPDKKNYLCVWGGASIAAPEIAGFFAQENSYLLTLGANCGPAIDHPCAPLGPAGPALFAAVHAAHNPFYDITTGNNSNDLSAGLQAAPGYDQATGLGSANMMHSPGR